MAHRILLTKNLIYTAVTRAKKRVILVGQKRALFKRNEIVQLCAFCRSLGAHVREVQDGASFTAMLWEGADSVSERDAAEIQRKIKRKTAEYPGFVCYCFDAFSTLIYRV